MVSILLLTTIMTHREREEQMNADTDAGAQVRPKRQSDEEFALSYTDFCTTLLPHIYG